MAGPFYVDDGGGKAVTAATNANPCQVTIVGHGFSNGDKVVFHSVGGMTQINFTNGSTGYTVTVVDVDNITIGVDSSAYGVYTSGGTAHNGLSWGAAFTSLSALDDVFTFAAGEIIYIGHDHVCQYVHTASRVITAPASITNPVRLISATQGSDPPTYQKSSTNQINTTEGAYYIQMYGCWAMYGVRINSGSFISFYQNGGGALYTEDCTLAVAANSYVALGSGAPSSSGFHKNLTVDLTADGTTNRSASVITGDGGSPHYIDGLTFVNAAYRTGEVFGGNSTTMRVVNADFSGFTNATTCEIVSAAGTYGGRHNFSHCKMAATWTPMSATSGQAFHNPRLFVACGSGDAVAHLYYVDKSGVLASTTSVYRTGGATIEGVPCAWLVTTHADCSIAMPLPLETHEEPWIYGRLASTGSKTFDVYITNDTADFDDDEVWLEVEYKADASSGKWTMATDKIASITTTPAAQTDDATSTWNGTGPSFTYKQKLSVTATVNTTGLFRARVCCGVASIAASRYFYIDPKVTVS